MKGFFTQGVFVLTGVPLPLEEMRTYLPEFPFLRIIPPATIPAFGGATAVVPYRPAANGYVLIDSVSGQWPDHGGDPKADARLHAAWNVGHFGPFAYPGGLQRAVEHAWFWNEARERVPEHVAFVRLRMSYALDAGPDAPVMPVDCNPQHELTFLTDIARCLLRHPATICYFNSSGEALIPFRTVDELLDHNIDRDLPSLDLWCNVRRYNLAGGWMLMDSIGNWQLDMPDHEIVFPKGAYDPEEAANFLRAASIEVLSNGTIFKDGDAMEGPGGAMWRARHFDEGVILPPRNVICWFPDGVKDVPIYLTRTTDRLATPGTRPKRPWWKVWAKAD